MVKRNQNAPQPVKTSRPATNQLRLDPQFLKQLRMVCVGLDVSPGHFVEERLRPILEEIYDQAVESARPTKREIP